MDRSFSVGRYLFAATLALFGVQHLVFASTGAFAPGPPWNLYGHAWAYLVGVGFLAASVSLATSVKARAIAATVGVAFFVYAVCAYLPGLVHDIRDGAKWTNFAELLCLSGVAFGLAGMPGSASDTRNTSATLLGRVLYGAPLIVFGAQHFIYPRLIVSLIPNWIPGRPFLAYFVGVAFFAASLSLLTGWKARWAASLLGIQFGAWVLMLHIPRAIAASHGGNEWTSTIIALGMCGGGWILAGSVRASSLSRSPYSTPATTPAPVV